MPRIDPLDKQWFLEKTIFVTNVYVLRYCCDLRPGHHQFTKDIFHLFKRYLFIPNVLLYVKQKSNYDESLDGSDTSILKKKDLTQSHAKSYHINRKL